MTVLDKFYIKVDENDVYSSNGTLKSLREIHTHNTRLFPEHGLPNYIHQVLSAIGENPNAFRQIYSTDTSKFVNESEGINFLFDSLSDAAIPMISGRLYKSNIDHPVMNPYMVAVLDEFSTAEKTRISVSSGTYSLNRYGSTNTFRNSGIIEIQGAGGGSGGTNNTNSDAAGGGGAAGGFAAIYYRIKNSSSNTTMSVTVGASGAAGGAGTGDGGTGGNSIVSFTTPSGATYTITCYGGGGGQTGNYNYTKGGTGGDVYFNTTKYASGGTAGSSSTTPTSGTVFNGPVVLVNDNYLCLVLLVAEGGAGGGRGDDTDGNPQGQAGANSLAVSYSIPFTHWNAETSRSLSAKSGGVRGANVQDATPGGGGASVYVNGGDGGAASTTGNAGSYGSGAGGAGCGNNANRGGSAGGSGIIYYFN